MSFQFSLAAVLRLRQSLEDRERLRLEGLHARQAALLHELQQNRDTCKRMQASVRRSLQKALTPAGELQFFNTVGESFAGQRRQLQAALQSLRREIATQEKQYAEQRQEREILETLRQARLAEYRIQQQRREQAALDELHLLRRHCSRAGFS